MSTALPREEIQHLPADRIIGFLSYPQSASQSIPARPAEILKGLLDQNETLVVRLCTMPSRAKFLELRDAKRGFVKYWSVVRAVTDFITVVVDDEVVMRQLVLESMNDAQQIFELKGVEELGDTASGEALFSLSTIKRIHRLVPQVFEHELPKKHEAAHQELASRFAFHMAWSLLHLDCLRLALERQIRLVPEVQDEILAGTRACVMAYSSLRQALDLRKRGRESRRASAKFDEEDRALAEESVADLEILTPTA